MCARFFILIICVIAAYITITVAAFIYLEWWQAILASTLTLILIVLSIKYLIRYFVGSLASFAKGLMEGKSRVLRNATADIHSVKPGTLPRPLAEWVRKVETEGPDTDNTPGDPNSDLVQLDKLKNHTRWYVIEATIFPDAGQAKGMTHWDVDDLRLVPIDAKVTLDRVDDDEDYDLHDVQLVEAGDARSLEGAKLHGPQRLRFTVGVPTGERILKFRYYLEQFGRVELPAPLRLMGG